MGVGFVAFAFAFAAPLSQRRWLLSVTGVAFQSSYAESCTRICIRFRTSTRTRIWKIQIFAVVCLERNSISLMFVCLTLLLMIYIYQYINCRKRKLMFFADIWFHALHISKDVDQNKYVDIFEKLCFSFVFVSGFFVISLIALLFLCHLDLYSLFNTSTFWYTIY